MQALCQEPFGDDVIDVTSGDITAYMGCELFHKVIGRKNSSERLILGLYI